MQQDGTLDRESSERLAIGLGCFSIGLGLAELLAPRALARLTGLPVHDRTQGLVRAFGAREVATGLAILSQPERAAWLWTRVAGDALDASTLLTSARDDQSDGGRLAGATAAVLGVTAIDILAARRLAHSERAASGRRQAVRVEDVVTIHKPIEQVYASWRDLAGLPRFMRHLESVSPMDNRRSRWRAKAPAGMTAEWVAELVEDRENEWLAWRSLEGSEIRNSGSVRFSRAPGARGTEVRVQLQWAPPAGALGRGIAWLFGEEPEQQIRDDLRRFKQWLETGEIAVSDGPGLRPPAQPSPRTPRSTPLEGAHR